MLAAPATCGGPDLAALRGRIACQHVVAHAAGGGQSAARPDSGRNWVLP
jgi:hypothetical protein